MLKKFKSLLKKEKKKNVILVALDGVRLDFMRDFPEFKKLSNRGLLFNNVVAYAPHSIASFHAIFTGIYGCHNGVNSYFGTPKFKGEECKTLTEYFKDLKYSCFGDTMNDLVIPRKGFDNLIEQEAFSENFVEDHKKIISKIKEKNDKGQACFVHLHCSFAHNDVVTDFMKAFKDKDKEFFANKEENIATYKKSLQKVDEYIKTITDLFNEFGLFDNSSFVFFSDHGTSVGEKFGERGYGTFCYYYSLKTFCLFIDKDNFHSKEVSQLIRNVDYTPTLLEMFSIAPDKKFMELDGESLLAFTKDDPVKERIAFAETGGISGPWPSPKEPNIHVICSDSWKLIFNRFPKTFELYNLKNDPAEEKNLIEVEKEKFEELKDILGSYTLIE